MIELEFWAATLDFESFERRQFTLIGALFMSSFDSPRYP
jgi:hypothetical protein